MGASIYILLGFFIISNTLCQNPHDPNTPENYRSVKVCEVCICSEISDFDGAQFVFNILCSELDRIKNVTDLDKIIWPQNPNGLKISATFEGLELMTLGKLPPNSQIESLRFPNNAIEIYWPEPFRDVPNLRRLSLAGNRLKTITFDMFKGTQLLEDLDLSDNRISDINKLCFRDLKNLKKLNLQNNHLVMIPLEALLPLTALEDLDIGTNRIYDLVLQTTSGNGLTGLKRLSLKGNQIRSVMSHAFPDNNNLDYLDLSENKIELVEEESLLATTKLKELILGRNNITLIFELPASLEICILRMNSMHHWPRFPDGIKYIDLSYNRLETMFGAETKLSNLEILYLGGNRIEEFSVANSFPKLFNLDLSYNLLKEVPKTLSSQNFPNLEDLWLDGNPMERVYFGNVLVLRKLHLNDMPKLVKIEEKAFTNIAGNGGDGEEEKCLPYAFSLYMSNCRHLADIHENAFEGTAVCMLDISYNNLSYLPRELLQWETVTEGVNLQHNPWRCACPLQWMLELLLPLLYRRHAQLLDDVRCGSPRAAEQLRLVHWYNWTDTTLCQGFLNDGPRFAQSNEGPFSNVSMMTFILSGAILVLSIIAMGLIIYLVMTRRNYRVRQGALRRKKQTAADVNKNGFSDEIRALNKT